MKIKRSRYLLSGAGFLMSILFWMSYTWYHSEYEFQLISDFEENDRVMMVYSPRPYIIELIVELSKYESVGIILKDRGRFEEAQESLAKANTEHIQYAIVPEVDQWIRDVGPAILKNGRGQLRAVEFFSPKKFREPSARAIANGLKMPLINSEVQILGGARESNGEGLLITTEAYFKNVSRGIWNKKKLTKQLKKGFAVKQVLWLENGLIEDEPFNNGPIFKDIYPYGSGAHVDEFCRFINYNTVLLAEVESEDRSKHPIYAENHKRMEENFERLQAWKKPKLNIVRVPAAELKFQQITPPNINQSYTVALPASYLNFVIGNKCIIAARYFLEGMPESVRLKDEKARAILQSCFPKHEIVQLNPDRLNIRGGGFHCITFNIPTNKRKLKRKLS